MRFIYDLQQFSSISAKSTVTSVSRRAVIVYLLVALVGLMGCGDDDPGAGGENPDASGLADVDTGARDTGARDTGPRDTGPVDSGPLDAADAEDVRDVRDGGQQVDASDVMQADTADTADAADASQQEDATDASDAPAECVGTGDLAGAVIGDDCDTANLGVCRDGEVVCDQNSGLLVCEQLEQPSAETCDGLDNDCDGDGDEDLFADCALQEGVCTGATVACTNGQYPSCIAADYGADYEVDETLCDGLDNDCDGQIDEGCTCTDGDQQPCYGGPAGTAGVGECQEGIQTCSAGSWGACSGEVIPTAEICDGLDNDCDGDVDEGVLTTYYLDEDGDGWGVQSDSIEACAETGDYTTGLFGDCDDTDPNIYPGATEVCDGVDNDCDNAIDEGLTTRYYHDRDADGYGSTTELAGWFCSDPSTATDLYSTSNDDCDDQNPQVNPGHDEVCDGIDNNCSGFVDEADPALDPSELSTFYLDDDGDGFGTIHETIERCFAPTGYVADDSDCDDHDPAIHPGADEVCDGVDNDCDGDIDENLFVDCPLQEGVCSGAQVACTGDPNPSCTAADYGPGYEVNETICEGLDNDCDGDVDEGLETEYFADQDGDNYGDPTDSIMACNPIGHYDTTDATDCNDSDSDVFPGQTQYFDSPHSGTPRYDYNCDGTEEKRWTDEASIPCSSVGPNYCDNASNPQADGWQDGTAPKCGVTEWYVLGCYSLPNGACVTNRVERTQECR